MCDLWMIWLHYDVTYKMESKIEKKNVLLQGVRCVDYVQVVKSRTLENCKQAGETTCGLKWSLILTIRFF